MWLFSGRLRTVLNVRSEFRREKPLDIGTRFFGPFNQVNLGFDDVSPDSAYDGVESCNFTDR